MKKKLHLLSSTISVYTKSVACILLVLILVGGLTGCSRTSYSFYKDKEDVATIQIVQLEEEFPSPVGNMNEEERLRWMASLEILNQLPADSECLDELQTLSAYHVFPPSTQILGVVLLITYNDGSFEVISDAGSIIYSITGENTYDYDYKNVGLLKDEFDSLLSKYH